MFAWNCPLWMPFPMPEDGVDKDSGMLLWNCCFSSSSFGVLQRIVCIHLLLRKAASNLVWRTIAARRVSAQHTTCVGIDGCQCSTLCGPSLLLSVSEPVSCYLVWWVLRVGGHFSVALILEWTCSAWLLVGSAVWRWKALDSRRLSCAASLLVSWCLQ